MDSKTHRQSEKELISKDKKQDTTLIMKKIRGKTIFTFFNPVVVEPLELEYIEKILADLPLKIFIEDPFFTDNHIEGDIYLFNGYNTGFEAMKKEAKRIKNRDPKKIIIVSGVDVQVNGERYMVECFDFVYTSPDLAAFRGFMERLLNGEIRKVPGLIINRVDHWEKIPMKRSPESVQTRETFQTQEVFPMPSRRFYHQHKEKTRYLHYREVALVKKSLGCPYTCRFCFCRALNNGQYVEGSFQRMFEEMETIDARYFWVVDDVFLKNHRDVEGFLGAQKEHEGRMKETTEPLIVYLRADFIRTEKESLKALKEAGVTEIIIGLESVKEETLKRYQKGVTGDENAEAVKALKEAGISYTALFMVDPSHRVEDFKALRKFIRLHGIKKYTFSIFTPIQGADDYEEYKEEIMDFDQRKYDFLHLVLPPRHMSRKRFQWEFAKLHIFQFFHSADARRFLLKSIAEPPVRSLAKLLRKPAGYAQTKEAEKTMMKRTEESMDKRNENTEGNDPEKGGWKS